VSLSFTRDFVGDSAPNEPRFTKSAEVPTEL
jgi:hypothetical protein